MRQTFLTIALEGVRVCAWFNPHPHAYPYCPKCVSSHGKWLIRNDSEVLLQCMGETCRQPALLGVLRRIDSVRQHCPKCRERVQLLGPDVGEMVCLGDGCEWQGLPFPGSHGTPLPEAVKLELG